jgi:hypothetical protein
MEWSDISKHVIQFVLQCLLCSLMGAALPTAGLSIAQYDRMEVGSLEDIIKVFV